LARLLLVEDEPAQLSYYRCLFEKDGHDVVEARCGEEAIAKAKSFCPAVVIMDLVLPDMTGAEAISKILSECGRPRIVINTNYESFRLDFRCWGADAFVVKSTDPSELQSAVREVLAQDSPSRRESGN